MRAIRGAICALAILGASLVLGCAEEGVSNEQAQPGADTTEASSSESGSPALSSEARGEDEIVCCEFSGALGTATKAKCEKYQGKIVEGLAPPCTK